MSDDERNTILASMKAKEDADNAGILQYLADEPKRNAALLKALAIKEAEDKQRIEQERKRLGL